MEKYNLDNIIEKYNLDNIIEKYNLDNIIEKYNVKNKYNVKKNFNKMLDYNYKSIRKGPELSDLKKIMANFSAEEVLELLENKN